MSTQLSFNLEELAQKRVVGLGDYQLAKLPTVKRKRPHLQLVDATYIERARAKSRHPAGSKLACPPAVGRENRTEGAAAAFDSLPQWVRRAPRLANTGSTHVATVPPVATVAQPGRARRSAPQKTSARNFSVPGISRKLSQVSLALLMVAGALLAGAGIGNYWDAAASGEPGINQLAGEPASESGPASSADLLLGQ